MVAATVSNESFIIQFVLLLLQSANYTTICCKTGKKTLNRQINMNHYSASHKAAVERECQKVVGLVPPMHVLLCFGLEDLLLLCQNVGVPTEGSTSLEGIGRHCLLRNKLVARRDQAYKVLQESKSDFREAASGEMMEELMWKVKDVLAGLEDADCSKMLKVRFCDSVYLRNESYGLITSSLRSLEGVKRVELVRQDKKDEIVVAHCSGNFLVIKLAGRSLFDESLTSQSPRKHASPRLLSYYEVEGPDCRDGFSYGAILFVQTANRTAKKKAQTQFARSSMVDSTRVHEAPPKLSYDDMFKKNMDLAMFTDRVLLEFFNQKAGRKLSGADRYKLFETALELTKDIIHEDHSVSKVEEDTFHTIMELANNPKPCPHKNQPIWNEWRKCMLEAAMKCLKDDAEICGQESSLENLASRMNIDADESESDSSESDSTQSQANSKGHAKAAKKRSRP